MRTSLFFDPLFLRHQPGEGHPDTPLRLERTVALLRERPVEGAIWQSPRKATREELLWVHSLEYVALLESLAGKRAHLDEDTVMSPDSFDAAILAAGAAIQATEEVLSGRSQNAFALVRPPGHHAEPEQGMGFCLLNNVALAAEAARRAGAERVLILDWDAHHGNGTQEAFEARKDVLYASCHRFPFYPGTGAATELGVDEGRGYTVNCALPAGCTDQDYAAVFSRLLLPIAREFRPSLVLVSAGFDAHEDDPLGGMRATTRGFAALCTAVRRLAEQSCEGKLVLVLEGGYDLEALAASVHACVEVLAGGLTVELTDQPGTRALGALVRSREALRPFWPGL